MITKYLKKLILLSILILNLFIVATPTFVQATTMSSDIAAQLQAATQEKGAGYGAARDPRLIIVDIVRMALGFLSMIFICLTLYAGYLWMTAGGNEEEVTKAKTLLYQAVIGLGILLSAYGITRAVVTILLGQPIDYSNGVYIQPYVY